MKRHVEPVVKQDANLLARPQLAAWLRSFTVSSYPLTPGESGDQAMSIEVFDNYFKAPGSAKSSVRAELHPSAGGPQDRDRKGR